MKHPEIVVVGFGRVGGALSLAFRKAGRRVAALPRSGASIRAAARLRVPLADLEALSHAKLCFLTVPDRAIAEVAAELESELGKSTALVHCAGALALDALGPSARTRASFHPLCAVSSREDSLTGSSVAISGSTPSLARMLRVLARDIGLRPFAIDETKRASYHAGAMLAAGGLVSLAAAAVDCLREAGVSEPEALAALIPLMHSALNGLEQRGLPEALTGPVARGDAETIERHLASIPTEAREVYVALTRRSLSLAQKKLSADVCAQLEKLLRGSKP